MGSKSHGNLSRNQSNDNRASQDPYALGTLGPKRVSAEKFCSISPAPRYAPAPLPFHPSCNRALLTTQIHAIHTPAQPLVPSSSPISPITPHTVLLAHIWHSLLTRRIPLSPSTCTSFHPSQLPSSARQSRTSWRACRQDSRPVPLLLPQKHQCQP